MNIESRSSHTEIMDDFFMEGELLRSTLDKIAWINQWLGGNHITMSGLKELLKEVPKEKELTIVDLGCGNGDMLRLIARYGRQINRPFKLIGIDANAFTVQYAEELSQKYPEITYMHTTVPSTDFTDLPCDIILSTLFLHHFSDEEGIDLLSQAYEKAKIGMVINDLHRSMWAYRLFQLLTLFIPNPMVRKDGLTSILRGFKRREFDAFEQKLGLKNSQIRWKWAFRYQWILFKRQ